MLKPPSLSNKKLFFSDLDNTLIFSHRHKYNNCIWIESINNRNQSFMTYKTYNYFINQHWLDVVPITTRTMQQYERLIEIIELMKCPHALICNGAILMHGKNENCEWRLESERIAHPFIDELEALKDYSLNAFGSEAIVYTEPFMFYVKSKEPADCFKLLLSKLDYNRMTIYHDKRKVYCFPSILNKGNAALRYIKKYGYSDFIAAGDSEFDIPMLNLATRSLCPHSIANSLNKCIGVYTINDILSDSICDILEKIRNEES